jgi:hypothetical protein
MHRYILHITYIVLVVAQARITSNEIFTHPALPRAPRHRGRWTNTWPDMPHKGQRSKTLQCASTGKGHIGSNVSIEPLQQRMQNHQPESSVECDIAAPGKCGVASRGASVKAREDPVTYSQGALAQSANQYQINMRWEQYPEHWEPACAFLQQDEATRHHANGQTQETNAQKIATKRGHISTPTAPDAAPCVDDEDPDGCYLEHR